MLLHFSILPRRLYLYTFFRIPRHVWRKIAQTFVKLKIFSCFDGLGLHIIQKCFGKLIKESTVLWFDSVAFKDAIISLFAFASAAGQTNLGQRSVARETI